MKIFRLLALFILCATLGISELASGATLSFGVMGASESTGTTPNGSWVPYLVNERGLNFGPGQSYNFAVDGATSGSLLSGNQHVSVANLVQSGDVKVAFLVIGGNDFNARATDIATGALSGAGLDAWAQSIVSNIDTAMDTVLAEHPLGMVVAGMPDILLTPSGRAGFSDPTTQARGEAAIDLVNSYLKPQVLSRGLVYVDLAGSLRNLNSMPFIVGGVTIDTVNAGSSTDFFQDGLHPGTVGNGFFANTMLSAVNVGYGTNYALITDQEILTTAGLGGNYTGETSTQIYSQYVSFAPEPSSFVLAACGAGGLLLWIYFRRRVTA